MFGIKTNVGMADMKIVKAPHFLSTIGLGSCIGIALFDPLEKIAGLAHIMLPESSGLQGLSNPAKFADTAVEKLLADMENAGAFRENLRAKIAGGAQMFNFDSKNEATRIGDRNTKATKEVLEKHRIPLMAEETGGTFGRTIEVYPETCQILIKAIGQEYRYI